MGDSLPDNSIPNKRDLILLDGGTGREIERQGGPFRTPEWSALALYEDPSIVQQVHESFLEAGATVITTNTYAVVPFHLGQDRYDRDGKRLLNLAVDLAVQARADRGALIAGSIPPICGSYEPFKFDKAVAGPVLGDFLDAYKNRVDVLLLETIGSVEEAAFYLATIQERKLNLPVWLSFCIKSDYGFDQPPQLMTGETLTQAVNELSLNLKLLQSDKVPVVLVNCCDTKLVTASLLELAATLSLDDFRIGAYPNAFSIPPPDAANHTLRKVNFNMTPETMQRDAQEWIKVGASVLGGCCGVGPDHIQAMAKLK